MELLKKHYEKIILIAVLLGVVIFAFLLLGRVEEERIKLEDWRKQVTGGTPKPVQAVDLSTNQAALKTALAPAAQELSGPHNLINPVKWLKMPNGTIIKLVQGDEVLRAFEATAIRKLYFSITFDGPRGAADSVRYQFTITDEGAAAAGGRKPVIRTLAAKKDEKTRIDSKNELAIREIRGPVSGPTELVMELTGDKELFTLGVGKEKGLKRVVGHEADAKFPPENKVFKALRLNSTMQFNNDTYKVIAIDDSTVSIEAVSNQQRKDATLAPAP